MTAYYNENDKHAAAWLRELIRRNLIAHGDVDERSIEDVRPIDLAGYTQCHFFAGIGGWSYALRLAGWPDDKPVWTGSCPCQPFSAAGKGAGFADERHLWPAWFHLVRQCKPAIVFGEQVASKDGLGWLDLVQADMEGAGYACGAVDLCAAGIGAPHIRQRLWFVADAYGGDAGTEREQPGRKHGQFTQDSCFGVALGDTNFARLEGRQLSGERSGEFIIGPTGVGGMVNASGEQMGVPGRARLERVANSWRNPEFIPCVDGKSRPVEPGTFPLAHGVPGRVVRLRGYGNAINPEVAAEVIGAYLDCRA